CCDNERQPTQIYPLSLHDALPISIRCASAQRTQLCFAVLCYWALLSGSLGTSRRRKCWRFWPPYTAQGSDCFIRPSITKSSPLRSEEHTSELQSRENLVCRLLLEK